MHKDATLRMRITHQIKSLQWEQNVGCLKNRAMKQWSLTLKTFFFLRAPLRRRDFILFSPTASPSAPCCWGSPLLSLPSDIVAKCSFFCVFFPSCCFFVYLLVFFFSAQRVFRSVYKSQRFFNLLTCCCRIWVLLLVLLLLVTYFLLALCLLIFSFCCRRVFIRH